MNKHNNIVKPTILILLSVILLGLLIKFIIDYSGLLGTNDIHFYNFDENYKSDVTAYTSDNSNIAFEYPSSWLYSISTENTKTLETITLDTNNTIKISYIPLDPKFNNVPINLVVDGEFNELINNLSEDNYKLTDNVLTYIDGQLVKYLKFKKDDDFIDIYTWINKNNYLCDITFQYKKSKASEFDLIFETFRFVDPNKIETYKSKYSSLTFKYPTSFSKLGVFVDEHTGTIDETLLKDENTSITISLINIENISEKEFLENNTALTKNHFYKSIEASDYTLLASGVFNVNINKIYYNYYKKDNSFIYIYSWIEETNENKIGGTVTFRFTKNDSSILASILRSVSFDDTK